MSVPPLRAILVGCGAMANHWAEVAVRTPGLELVGLTDMHRPAAEAMAARHKLPPALVFDTLGAALAATPADVVFDVTVPAAHDAVTIEALRAGCHVLGEKPMSDTLAKAQRMVEEARSAQRTYAVIQNRRYEPNIQRVARLLRSGALGQVEELHADFFIGAHFGGFRDEMDFPLILDMAIHTFDAARYLAAADPVSVYCHSFNPKRSWFKGDASAIVVFELRGAGGEPIVYSYRGSWCAEGAGTSWNSAWRVVGSRGSLLWDGADQVKGHAVKAGGKPGFTSEMEDVPVPDVKLEHQGHEGLIREFVECVRSGKAPQTACEDNIKSLAMVLAAVESAKSGRREMVTW